MNRVYDLFERFSRKFVIVFVLITAIGFVVVAGISSNVFPEDYEQESAWMQPDSLLLNLLALVLGLLLCKLAQKLILRGDTERQKKILDRIVYVLCVLLFAALVVWIHSAHGEFGADQLSVFEGAVEMLHGNYNSVSGYAEYFQFYPHQLSLVFLWQLILTVCHTESEIVIKYLNAICCVVIIYFGYRIVKELTESVKVYFCYVMLGFTFIPMYLYVHYIYGDVISMALANVAIWAVMRWCKERRVCYMVTGILSILFGVIARKNFSIILIAIVIGLLYFVVKNKCRKTMLMVVLSVVLAFGSTTLIQRHYESKAGVSKIKGMPVTYWLCTGMQESSLGSGVLNLDLLQGFYDIGEMDHDLYDSHLKAIIPGRIRDMINAPFYIPRFYYDKVTLQWNDYLFSSTYLTVNTKYKLTDLEWSVYYGSIHEIISSYMNWYMFALYVGLAVGMLSLRKNKMEIYEIIPLIAIIGGVLFSIIWEAKGRYVMPYVVLMQPFASMGLARLMELPDRLKDTKISKFYHKDI